jgi:hypothetical protein
MNSKNHLYLGKAGQFAAMSIFLMRGWNVATPEVDVGDDLFVLEDKKGVFVRIQVKTSKATVRNNSYSARFKIPLKQLTQVIYPELYYVLEIGSDNQWLLPIIIRRDKLNDLFLEYQIGSIVEDNLMLYFSFQNNQVKCSEVDFSPFLNNFDDFPIIVH